MLPKRKKLSKVQKKRALPISHNSPVSLSANALEDGCSCLDFVDTIPLQITASNQDHEQEGEHYERLEQEIYNFDSRSEFGCMPCEMFPVSEDEDVENQEELMESYKYRKQRGKFTGEDIVNIENNFEIVIENSSIDFKSWQRVEKKREQKNVIEYEGVVKKTNKNLPCRCKKSHCLKNHCECFLSNHGCNDSCSCVDCANWGEIQKPRKTKPKVNYIGHKTEKKVGSCQCKRTKCSKKYCECFSLGKICGQLCTCENCTNHHNIQ